LTFTILHNLFVEASPKGHAKYLSDQKGGSLQKVCFRGESKFFQVVAEVYVLTLRIIMETHIVGS